MPLYNLTLSDSPPAITIDPQVSALDAKPTELAREISSADTTIVMKIDPQKEYSVLQINSSF